MRKFLRGPGLPVLLFMAGAFCAFQAGRHFNAGRYLDMVSGLLGFVATLASFLPLIGMVFAEARDLDKKDLDSQP